jgi:hypothetical protein
MLLKPCPFCGKEVEVHGGAEEWTPTFYDPDSGGEPYYISCDCGLSYSIGYCDYKEFKDTWNNRIGSMNQVEGYKLVAKYRNDDETADYIKGYKTGYDKAIENILESI